MGSAAYEPTNADQDAVVIDSAPIEQLVADSTVDIAGALNEGAARWRAYKTGLTLLTVFFVAIVALTLRGGSESAPIAVLALVAGAAIVTGAIAIHGRQSSTVSLDYELTGEESERFEALSRAFGVMASCSGLWRIPLEKQETDWKRNAGASKTVQRTRIAFARSKPPLVASNVDFLQLPLGKETIYLTPDAVLVVVGGAIAAMKYADVDLSYQQTRFIEDGQAPSDATVVGETWRYVNRKGGPDRRFNNNRQLPICLYGEIDFLSASGLKERIHCSRTEASQKFASAFHAMRVADVSVSPPPMPRIEAPEATDVRALYANETEAVRSLALNHGKLWEFLLVQELLGNRLWSIKAEHESLSKLPASTPTKRFSGAEFTKWVGSQTSDLSAAIHDMSVCIDKSLIDALGAPGVPGDEAKILKAVNSLFLICRRFVDFELSVRAAMVPPAFETLRDAFHGIGDMLIRVVEDLTNQWNEKTEALKAGATSFEVKVRFEPPPQIAAVMKEFDRMQKHPERFRD
ncbi:hypothetical protein [Bradyrhizobium sp. B120]|uniref:hypothetical protein n=1 Tax=Bradyrhizobium sp. B120 TaxID=3410088 RepID=UPI003B97DC3E